jgi:predicted nucleic acid-binding protein
LTDNGSLILEPISTAVVIFCLEIIVKHHIPINDSIHLYSALLNKTKIEEFICSDKMLLEAAKKEGFKVEDPEDLN